jgi:glyoxylase-like metal-dependent hydrolase (beta-lactamase superfamily II)
MGAWQEVLPDLLRWRDSCNVYAVVGPDACLIVDAGTGEWLGDGLAQLPVPPAALVLTHYFRDHAAGAADAARAGIPVHVPEGELAIFTDPAQHFRKRETYLIYDNIWDLFAPVEPVPVAGLLRDYERLRLAGLDLRVLPLPGATPTQLGIVLRTPQSGRLVAFCGETIHSPGRLARLAPLQYNYIDLVGTVNVAFSAALLRKLEVEMLLPSLGEPIASEPGAALELLHENLLEHAWDRTAERTALGVVGRDRVQRLSESVWRSTQANAASHFILGREGQALAIDYGYWHAAGSGAFDLDLDFIPSLMPAYPYRERRRALLHSLDPLRREAGVEGIAAVIPTHYHDDHVCGIPLLQRLYGTPCWAPANFAAHLAEPTAHRFPCTSPGPIRVDRALALEESLEWEGIRFHFAEMSGHTRFAALLGWEVDGIRYVHGGDQYSPVPAADGASWSFTADYVYANGAHLDSYRASAAWIAAFRPDVVLSGHWAPVETSQAYFDALADYGREYERRHRRVMALAPEEAHFGVDSMAGWIWPYRVHLSEPGPIDFAVTVRNPLATDTTMRLCLSGPDGWEGSTVEIPVRAREEAVAHMSLTAGCEVRRQPVVVEVHAGGRPFGQLLEALVTVGGSAF